MAATATLDQAKTQAFMGKVIGDLSGTYVTTMCILGDRLDLFKDLERRGPATSGELAARAGINERYAREWLSALACAGYLEYDPATRRFTLPPEHAPAFAHEGGPMFLCGASQGLPAQMAVLDQITHAFRHGGGVPQSAYHPSFYDSIDRFTTSWFENQLLQQWLPAMPIVTAKLERGADLADVGCGQGRALIKLAQAFPNSRFVGYDVFAPSIARAIANAEAAGLAGRIRFEQRDVSDGLPGQYDVITTFDVVHDSVNPRGLLLAIRKSLRPGGRYICLDINSSDKLEENAGPLGAYFYSVSVLYCMTTSLAHGGEGLGTAGLTESKLRELCSKAGFSSLRRLPLENLINSVYEIEA